MRDKSVLELTFEFIFLFIKSMNKELDEYLIHLYISLVHNNQ